VIIETMQKQLRRISILWLLLFIISLEGLSMVCHAQVTTTVRIDLNKTQQRIEGFGAALITFGGEQPYFKDALFDRAVNDLGLSLVRMPIFDYLEPTNDDDDPDNFHWDGFRLAGWANETSVPYRFWLLNEFKKRGVTRFIASPWSPPRWMKTQRSTRNGGFLRMDKTDEFAESLAAWIILGKKNYGIDFAAVTLQNELLFNHTFGSAVYHGLGVREKVRSVMRKFKKEGISTQLLIPEDMMLFERMREYIQPTMNDPETSQFSGGFCSHRIGGFDEVRRWREETKQYNRQNWMTETSGHQQTWDGAMKMASDMHDYLVGGNFSAWVYWQLTDSPEAGEYAIMVDGKPSPKFYAAKHFYRYVRPGAVRLETTPERGSVLASAYRHDVDGTLTLVLINNGATEANIKMDFGKGAVPQQFRTFQSTTTQGGTGEGCQEIAAVTPATTIILPPKSITTVYGASATLKTVKTLPVPPESWKIPAGTDAKVQWGNPTPIPLGDGFAITEAARNNDLEGIRAEIAKGHLNATRGMEGWNALHSALTAGAGDAVKLLIESGIIVNYVAPDGWTPLHAACASFGAGGDNAGIGRGYLIHDMFRMVMDKKPDVKARTKDGLTPLHVAAMSAITRDGSSVLRINDLLKAGADVNAVDVNGRTPLHFAAWQGFMDGILTIRHEVVQALIAGGANINQQDKIGRTPLHYASHMGYERIVAALLLAGAKIEIKDNEGKTPLALAETNKLTGTVALLNQKTAPAIVLANIRPERTPSGGKLGMELVRAAWDGKKDEVARLLKEGADPFYRDGDGFTALDRARDNGHAEIVGLLEAARRRE